MSRKRKDEASDGEQYTRFVETAKNVGADDEDAFEEALKKIVKAKPSKGKKKEAESNKQ